MLVNEWMGVADGWSATQRTQAAQRIAVASLACHWSRALNDARPVNLAVSQEKRSGLCPLSGWNATFWPVCRSSRTALGVSGGMERYSTESEGR